MANKEDAKKKVKISTAIKRDIQNEKKRLRNKVYRSKVRTAIRALNDAITKGESEDIKSKLDIVYSTLDKCVKKGIYKLNKVSRTKSRLAAKALSAK